MKLVSENCLKEQEDFVTLKHIAYMYIYKQWPGAIMWPSGQSRIANDIMVYGDASDFFAAGDYIISSINNLDTEYKVESVSYDSTNGRTTLTIKSYGTPTIVRINKEYLYKKYDVTEYIIDDNLGDIRKEYQNDDYGKIAPHQLNFSLWNDETEISLVGTKDDPGIFYKGVYKSIISAVEDSGNFTKIDLHESISGYDSALVKQYNAYFTSGDALNKVSKIVAVSTSNDRIYIYDQITDNLKRDDDLTIIMQNRYYCKVKYGVKGYSDDELNVFFGIIYPRNITYAQRRIDIISYSLVKDWDYEYSFQYSRANDRFPFAYGISPYNYQLGNKVVEEEYLAKVRYKFSAGNLQSVTGVEVNYASDDVGDQVRILRFRKPNWLQFDNGAWVQKDTEVDNQTLTARDGATINVNVRPADYAPTDAEELLFFDPLNTFQVGLLKRGPAGIVVDGGQQYQLLTSFFRIWVDETYASGTLNDEGDMSDVSDDDRPIQFIPNNSTWAIYFGSNEKFGGIKIEGLRELGVQISDLTFEYSFAFGDDPACFNTFSVTDGTSGFSQDGIIYWDIPDDWEMKAKIGSSDDFHFYYVRIRYTGSGATGIRTADRIFPLTSCYGSKGDIFTFDHNWEEFKKDDVEDEVIVRYGSSGDLILASWYKSVKFFEAYKNLIEKSGYGVNTSHCDGRVTLNRSVINIWGKINHDNRKPTALCGGSGNCSDYLFACIENAIYRLKDNHNDWELLFECEKGYRLISIHYFDNVIDEGSARNFILATGFYDPIPPGSILETDYHIQPKQIMIRIDDVDGDNYFVTTDRYDDGGDVNSYEGYSDGDGLVNTRYLFRSGAHHNVSGILGFTMRFGFVGHFSVESFYGENLIIPFNQITMRLNNFNNWGTLGGYDVDFDVTSLIEDIPVLKRDEILPFYLNPGYYMIVSNIPESEYLQQGSLDLRFTLGQMSGITGVYFPGGSSVGSGIYNLKKDYGLYGQTCDHYYGELGENWSQRWRMMVMYLLKYGKGADPSEAYSTGLGGVGLTPQSAWSESGSVTDAKFFARTQLLCADQKTPNSTTKKDYIIQGVYLDWYQMTGVNLYNEKRIELTSLRDESEACMHTNNMEIWHYDNSAGTWTNVGTTMPINVSLDQNDQLILADTRKFGLLYAEMTSSGVHDFDYYVSNGDGGFDATNLEWRSLQGNVKTFDYPMERVWMKDTGGAGGNISSNKYLLKIVQTEAGSVTFTRIGPKRREIWNSGDSYYFSGATKLYDFVPIDIQYDSYGDNIYGVFLDQLTIQYKLFCLPNVSTLEINSDTTQAIKICTLSNYSGDDEMQPHGLAVDTANGWCYFTMSDKKYKRKAAQLWRFRLKNNLFECEKLDDILYGNSDASDIGLVVQNGKVFGFTGKERGYFFEYSDDFYLRAPVLKLGEKTCRQSLNEIGQILNVVTTIDEDALTFSRKKLTPISSADKTWTEQQIVNIEFVRQGQSYDSIHVNWQDLYNDISGLEKIGQLTKGIGDNILEVSNDFIFFPQTARLIGQWLWDYYTNKGKEIEGNLIFLYQHRLFDAISVDLDNIAKYKSYLLDSSLYNEIKSLTLSWKRKNMRFVLLENNYESDELS